MRAVIRSIDHASRNTQQGISLVSKTDGALREASNVLGNMHELAVESACQFLGESDRVMLNQEFQDLAAQLDLIGEQSALDDTPLLDGSSVEIQTGPDQGDTVIVDMPELSVSALGLGKSELASSGSASEVLNHLDDAIVRVAQIRGDLGASMSTLEIRHSALLESTSQLSSAESRLTNADYAVEAADLAKQQILAKGAEAILSQSFINSSDAKRLLDS